MKKLISSILLIFCVALCVNSQNTINELTTPVIKTSSLSKNDQWHNLKLWVSLTFDSSNVVDMSDEEKGTMVIKWSCPVKMNSDFVSASVVSTYVIDVRDGKYRLQKLNPRIIYQLSRPDIYDDFDSARSAAATEDIKLISRIASRFYEGALEWPIDDKLNDMDQAYLELLSSTEQYRNERDRERGKSSDEWLRNRRNWQLIHTPLSTFRQIDGNMTSTLNDTLTSVDDF